jgi:predicted GNAT family acetyltransferase
MPDETDAGEIDARVIVVVDEPPRRRFQLTVDGQPAAFTQYMLEAPGLYAFTHTQTLPAFAGQGLATTLIGDVIEQLRAKGDHLLPYCPFVNGYLRRHPEDVDLVPDAERRRFGLAT